jgi:putative SOS response-associated peptidase YedK
MPVMLAPASAKVFITGPADEAIAMLKPYLAEEMHAHRVTQAMTKAGYDGPDCTAAI